MSISKRSVLASLAIMISLTGCFLDDKKDDKRTEQLNENLIQPGTYRAVRCYKNKQETVLAAGDRWSLADVTFNSNNTGSMTYTVYSDATCTTAVSSKTLNFTETTIGEVDSVKVFRLVQDGTVLNPTWWVPAKATGDGYSFDVDFTDGESGAYLGEPSPTDVADFKGNPGQGVEFKRQ